MLWVPAGNLSPGKDHRVINSYTLGPKGPPFTMFPSLLCPRIYSVFLISTSYVHAGLGLGGGVKGVVSLHPSLHIEQF